MNFVKDGDTIQISFGKSRRNRGIETIKTYDDFLSFCHKYSKGMSIPYIVNYIKENVSEWYDRVSKEAKTNDRDLIIVYLRNPNKLHYCKWCGKATLNQVYCCKHCSDSDPEKSLKQQETNLKRYGSRFNAQRPEAIAKRSQTLLEKYGNSKYVNLEARTKTIQAKYGVNNITETQLFREKNKKTRLEKYGIEFYTGEPRKPVVLSDEDAQSIFEQYGDFVGNMIVHKIRFGEDQIYIDRVKSDYNRQFIIDHFIEDGVFNQFEFAQYFNIKSSYAYKAKKHFKIDQPNKNITCKAQIVFLQQFNDFGIQINRRDIIKPQELDGYLPSIKLAIEFNGTMYHSIGPSQTSRFCWFRNPDYHYNKFNTCKEKGITLFSMFDYQNREFWKNLILDALNQNRPIDGNVSIIEDQNLILGFIKQYSIFEFDQNCDWKCIGLFDSNNNLIQTMLYNNNRILHLATKFGYKNDYSKIINYYFDNNDNETLTFKNNNIVGDFMIRSLNASIIDQLPPSCKYFTKVYQRQYRGDVVVEFSKIRLTENDRALYNCGYTVYQIKKESI